VGSAARQESSVAWLKPHRLDPIEPQPALARHNDMKSCSRLGWNMHAPRPHKLAMAVRDACQPEILQYLAQRIALKDLSILGRTIKHVRQSIMDRPTSAVHMSLIASSNR
jgi:hypothetical protein